MTINKMSLAARINTVAKEKQVSHTLLYQHYFFDCFLSRLAHSPYANRFIFKGGYYLETRFGIQNRATTDLDFSIRSLSLEKEVIERILNEIISFDWDDQVHFRMLGSDSIRKEDPYGGFRIHLLGTLANVRQTIDIDLATGDPITPPAQLFSYRTLISGETISLFSYNLETVMAEKLVTILERGLVNSRLKDFYDVYLMNLNVDDAFPKADFKRAFEATLHHKGLGTIDHASALRLIRNLGTSEIMEKRWNVFARKTVYAQSISFEKVLDVVEKWMNIVF